MANHDPFDIDYIAKLARLELSEQERSVFTEQLGKILDYFQKLGEVDTRGVEPMAHATPLYDVLREDVAVEPLPIAAALRNAPAATENQVVVPRVVE
jgi:aspartyl-tRNA(Asn)/glutamyl-tRNA(Gln) amidotransferase subunit C